MAWYTINYACGHGSFEKQLYGKTSGRESYVEWAERNMVCPDCYSKERDAKDDAAPQVASVSACIADPAGIVVALSGKITANKERIVAAGYQWGELPMQGGFDMLSSKAPSKAYHKVYAIKPSSPEDIGEVVTATIKQATDDAKALGYEPQMAAIDPVAIGVIRDRLLRSANHAAARPARPAWFAEMLAGGKSWNRKIYRGNRVYIRDKGASDGVEHKLTDEQAEELAHYERALTEWESKR